MCCAMAMFSSAVKVGSRLNRWNLDANPTASLRNFVRSASVMAVKSLPATFTSPSVGGVNPPIT